MKKILYIAAILSATLSFSACNPDSFEQVVTFNVPKENPKLVVSCEYLNGSDSLQVFVSSSWNTSDANLPSSKMDNCKVELFKGTQKIIELPYKLSQIGYNTSFSQQPNQLMQGYYVAKMNGALNEKETYTLKVSAAGFETVEAKSNVPQLVKIKKVTYKKDGFKTLGDGGLGSGSSIKDLLSIEFDDPNDENYYTIECIEYQRDTVTQKKFQVRKNFSINQKFDADVFSDGDYNTSLLFTDEIFNGKSFVFKMGVYTDYPQFFYSPNGNGSDLKKVIEGYDIRLHSISKGRFLFNNSLQAVYDNQGNPFGEPTPLYTNFDKGFGLFSFLNTSNYYIKIQ
jgi:hypothetical protein